MIKSDEANGRKDYFEALYDGSSDPWDYQSCEYEIAKRADTLSFLRDHYVNACEVGCSIGILTAELKSRCDHILGIDISPKAIAIAQQALASEPGVEFTVMHLPHEEPDGMFDLLVLSEMLYFLTEDELINLAELASRRILPGGDVLIVTYDGETQTRLNGRQATDIYVRHALRDFDLIAAKQREEYHVRLLRKQ